MERPSLCVGSWAFTTSRRPASPSAFLLERRANSALLQLPGQSCRCREHSCTQGSGNSYGLGWLKCNSSSLVNRASRSLHTCEPRPLLPCLPSGCCLKTLGLGSSLGSFPPFCPHAEQCPLNMEPSLFGPGTSILAWSFLTASSCSPDSFIFETLG